MLAAAASPVLGADFNSSSSILAHVPPSAPLQSESPVADSPAASDSSTAPDTADLTVERVTVEGNRLVPTEDILGVVKTKPGDHFDREKVKADLKAINNMGYFDDRSLQVLPELSNNGVMLKIRVQENAPVTEFSFQGNNVLSNDEISKIFSDQLGKPQNLNRLSAAIDKVEQSYHERGYLLARITDVKDDPDGSINLSINEGLIDKIQITGNKKTKDFIIRNSMKLKAGSVYNERQLTEDLRKLYANGYFKDIRRSLVPSADNADKYDLKIEVAEKRTGTVGLGGGIDTMTGPFGSFTVADSNFRGRGQIVQLTSQVGSAYYGNIANALYNGGTSYLPNKRVYQVQASFTEPHLFNTDTAMTASVYGRNMFSMMIPYAQQQTFGTGVTFSRQLSEHWSASLGVNAENTKVLDVGTLNNNTSAMIFLAERAEEMGTATTTQQAWDKAGAVRSQQLKGGAYLTVNPTVAYDTRDQMQDPHSGTYARLTASPSLGLANASFAKLGASYSKYVPVTKNTTFAFNIQGGTSFGGVPQFAQYWLGGFNGLPGYRQFTDLGTGTSLLMTMAEYRFPVPFLPTDGMVGKISKHVKLSLFAAAGGVGGNNTTNDYYQRINMGASVGIGLRLNVPMLGVVRINYGLPLISSALGKMTPRVTFGFGNQF
jgi:outer membrane protein insertion porin family